MTLVYDFIFFILVLFYLPLYIFKNKFHRGFLYRLGKIPRIFNLDRPVWIHAVSVGEALSIKWLYKELKKQNPDKRFVISTVTATGNKIVEGFVQKEDLATYLPLDLSFIVKKVINKVNPCLFIIAETEIWPNLISCLYQKKIPIIIVNARISDRSFARYRGIKFLVSPLLNKISLFCCQTDRDLQRLTHLGAISSKLKVTGNMKFDIPDYGMQDETAITQLRSDLRLNQEDKLLVAGSTHPQEEEIILEAYRTVLRKFPQLKLLIAPRHPERAKEIEGIISGFGFHSVLVSSLPLRPCNCLTKPVFVLDSIGKLTAFYRLADIVFVGGSLVKKGGHNILEPASLGKAILFGPYMFNFKDIAELFLKNQATVLAKNKEELIISLTSLLNNPTRTSQLGSLAHGLVTVNQGATTRNLREIDTYL
jgi:3-deoxy-D-manno-octulosonic-acid transferase